MTDIQNNLRRTVNFLSEVGIDFSDHRSFWKFNYNDVMVTDTAFYRNPQYHGIGDTPELLDYERMAKVILGLKSAIEEMSGTTAPSVVVQPCL